MLCLSPLIGAIAAGNCAIIKPSEIAPASSALLAEIIPKYIVAFHLFGCSRFLVYRYLDKECFRVFEGGVEPTSDLLRHAITFRLPLTLSQTEV